VISQQLFLSWKAPPLRALPRRPAPLLDETLNSYLNRLAKANHLATSSLRELLSGSRLKSVPVPPHRLARLTGYPERSLRYAILELSTLDELGSMNLSGRPRPGEAHQCRSFCGLCLLKQDVSPNNGSPVRWHHFEDVICWRHRRWIAFSGETAEPQPRLDLVEDVLHANRQHRRLCRRYGRKAVLTAFHDADYIFSSWTSVGRHQERFGKRMVALAGQGWKLATNQHGPAQAAGRYPAVVALTRLLVMPVWRALALSRRPGMIFSVEPALLAEIRRTVARDYARPGQNWSAFRSDALYGWIENERKNATMLLRQAKTATKKEAWFPGLAMP
ncbi:TniQ family protein, partial [Nonomuraea sp. RK-328]|nr:TniQ family protein [Nonomuraea sp. RK-328]